MSCKVIGLDTSTTCTGWSIFINGVYQLSGAFDKVKQKDVDIRIEEMSKDILNLLNKEQPDIVYIELPATHNNGDTLTKLCKVLGVVYGWCLSNQKWYEEFRPSMWRSWASEKGELKSSKRDYLKEWSKEKFKIIYGKDSYDDNESDATLLVYGAIKHYCKD